MKNEETRYSKIKRRIENHRILAILLFCVVVIIGVGKLTDSLDKILIFVQKYLSSTDIVNKSSSDDLGRNVQERYKPIIASNDNKKGEGNMAKDGKEFERLIQLIERSISPDAIVEHDVDMPVLNSSIGATTQCDIVIRSGIEPRQTVTIVEVQDRGSRVKPNDFRGWKQKLEDVGAQHLICVSRQEFPESIKEQASLLGNSIILVTLKEADPESLPLDFITFRYQYRHFDVIALDYVQPTMSKSEAISLGLRNAILSRTSIKVNDLCWSVDRQHIVSLYILFRDYYLPPDDLATGTGEISFNIKEEPPLYYLVNDIFIRVGLNCKFEWINEIIDKPVSVLTYEQNEFGALAWIAEVIHESPKGKIVLRLPLTKSGDNYIINSIYAEIPEDVRLSFGVGKNSN